jgi:nucleoside triphosphate pyrophosphatase
VSRIYLASRSPRRRELLRQIGVTFEIVLLREDTKRGLDIDETPLADETPQDYALRLALRKAELAAHFLSRRTLPMLPVLAADTTVVCDGRIFGKPADQEDAARMLKALAGRMHEVVSAIAVYSGQQQIERAVSVSAVWLRPLTHDEIVRYVGTGETHDKAGAYAIQGRAGAFVQRIDGSYSGIMGLPLAETAELLTRAGLQVP